MPKKTSYRFKRKREPYLIREYYCTRCRHIFHSARPEVIKRCNKCSGHVEVLGSYKSQKTPGISRKKPSGQWISPSEIFYIDRNQAPFREKL